jgi:hypothetical protein
MYLYCTCGTKNEYKGIKPKKCHSCDAPFDRAFEPPPRPAKAAKPRPRYGRTEPEAEDEYESYDMPSFEGIAFESTPKTTVGEYRKNGSEVQRHYDPELAGTREETLAKLLSKNGRPEPRSAPNP